MNYVLVKYVIRLNLKTIYIKYIKYIYNNMFIKNSNCNIFNNYLIIIILIYNNIFLKNYVLLVL